MAKILIIDLLDYHKENLQLLRLVLEKIGYQYAIIEDANEILPHLQSGSFDLIMMDYTWYQSKWSNQLKEVEQSLQDIGVLMPVGRIDCYGDDCFPSFIDGLVSIPFEFRDLLSQIENRLKKHSKSA